MAAKAAEASLAAMNSTNKKIENPEVAAFLASRSVPEKKDENPVQKTSNNSQVTMTFDPSDPASITQQMMLLHQAGEVLKNTSKRNKYDAFSASPEERKRFRSEVDNAQSAGTATLQGLISGLPANTNMNAPFIKLANGALESNSSPSWTNGIKGGGSLNTNVNLGKGTRLSNCDVVPYDYNKLNPNYNHLTPVQPTPATKPAPPPAYKPDLSVPHYDYKYLSEIANTEADASKKSDLSSLLERMCKNEKEEDSKKFFPMNYPANEEDSAWLAEAFIAVPSHISMGTAKTVFMTLYYNNCTCLSLMKSVDMAKAQIFHPDRGGPSEFAMRGLLSEFQKKLRAASPVSSANNFIAVLSNFQDLPRMFWDLIKKSHFELLYNEEYNPDVTMTTRTRWEARSFCNKDNLPPTHAIDCFARTCYGCKIINRADMLFVLICTRYYTLVEFLERSLNEYIAMGSATVSRGMTFENYCMVSQAGVFSRLWTTALQNDVKAVLERRAKNAGNGGLGGGPGKNLHLNTTGQKGGGGGNKAEDAAKKSTADILQGKRVCFHYLEGRCDDADEQGNCKKNKGCVHRKILRVEYIRLAGNNLNFLIYFGQFFSPDNDTHVGGELSVTVFWSKSFDHPL